ncbi:MAG: hypothetical protein M5U05_14390 [Anaerolineales bacterium]|nr:hypothetical protein [Anaerolineales bacterium]
MNYTERAAQFSGSLREGKFVDPEAASGYNFTCERRRAASKQPGAPNHPRGGDMTDHLEQGIQAFGAGEPGAAFLLFRQAIQENPENAAAWYWLSRVVDSPAKQRDSLERALQLDPNYQPVRDALAALDAPETPPTPAPAAESAAPEPAPPGAAPATETLENRGMDEPASPPPAAARPIRGASIWPYPRGSIASPASLRDAEPAPAIAAEGSHEQRLDALAELEPLGMEAEKPAPKRRRGVWFWMFSLLALLLLLVIGYAFATYVRLPSYESLVPLLATISPQTFIRGPADSTQQPAAGAPGETPASTPDVPLFEADDWALEPVKYERTDLGNGQSRLVVDLALANYSRFLGAVTIAQKGTLIDGDGKEYAVDFGYEAKMLILAGTRLHSVDANRQLRLELDVPTESGDYLLRVPFRASLLNLNNGLVSSGEGTFAIDAAQVVPGSPTMFVNESWEAFAADPPAGVFAVEPGQPADFLLGQIIIKALAAPVGDPAEPQEPALQTSIWNTSSAALTLRTRYPAYLQVYRDGQWGVLIPASASIQSLTAEPGQTTSESIWSAAVEELPRAEPETWCAVGLYEIVSGEERLNRGVVTCFPVAPPASP